MEWAATEDAAGGNTAQLTAHRSCGGCGKPLSRYNPDGMCSACTSAARDQGAGGCVFCGGGFTVPPSARLPLGERLAELRRGCGLTQQQLADRAHVSLSLVSQAERGRIGVSTATLSSLCTALGVPVAELFSAPRLGQREPDTGQRVRRARRSRGMTLEAAAGLAGKSKGWLSGIETGQLSLESARFGDVLALARVLQVPVPALTGVPYPGAY